MTKKKNPALPPRRYGWPQGTRRKPADERLLSGRRVAVYLLPADYGRLATEATRRGTPIATLVRSLIIAGLSGPI